MTEPLRRSLVVACSAEHAFQTWTARASAWWPAEHTVTHEPDVEIIFEGRAGGRIYERTAAGEEVEWGRITAWEPPRRLAYRWHIATHPANATDVVIVFEPESESSTRVKIEHAGWERLGTRGPTWRDVNHGGWDGVLPAYAAAANSH